MAGLVVELTPKLNFYSTYSTAFETPTTTEFNRQDGAGGFNESLEPQLADNFEVGLRGRIGDSQRYEVSLFTIDVEDELIGREIPTSPGRSSSRMPDRRAGARVFRIPTRRSDRDRQLHYSDFVQAVR
jgi:iron complex outermembrane receptor protein